jgi:L-asparaginase II
LLAARIRSGLVETVHDGAVAVVSNDGDLLASSGDIDRPFFLRSAAKPFQALIAQEEGAALDVEGLAIAASSHDGEPVHVALVESMLARVGLDGSALGCPPSWPVSEPARARLRGAGRDEAQRIWNNCSGKHAAWLRACLTQGWALESYLRPEHPLQMRIIAHVGELGEYDVSPVGVDGCGAPVLRTTTRVMALLYARLATQPRYDEVFTAMHRYPALVSGKGNGDASLATTLNLVGKRGAAGCLGVAIEGRLGIAVKSWDGLEEIATSAMIATLAAMGELPGHASRLLEPLARPQVLGGGRVVGELEPRVELRWA